MAKIISLTFYSRSSLVTIQLSSLEKFTLDAELVLEKGIGRGTEIEFSKVRELQKMSLHKRLRQQAFNYIGTRQRSTVEMKRYLQKRLEKGLSIFKVNLEDATNQTVIEDIINDLKERNYLNDEQYTKAFIEQKMQTKGKGKRALAYDLMKKGVDKSTINKLLNDVTVVSKEQTNTLIDKSIDKIVSVIRSRRLDKRKAREMLTRRLLSKGFTFDECRTKIDDWLTSEYNKKVN